MKVLLEERKKISTCPSKAWIALLASSLEVKVTNPKPLDLPVSRSVMIFAANFIR